MVGLILIAVIVADAGRYPRPDPQAPRAGRHLAPGRNRSSELSGGRGLFEPILVARNVSKAFKGVQALSGASLEVRRGEILGLVGPNGSGKSTFINVVSGHYPADSGSLRFEGGRSSTGARTGLRAPASRAPTRSRGRSRTSPCWKRGAAADVRPGVMDRARAEAEAWRWLEFTHLADKAHRYPGELNLHQRKFLELARRWLPAPACCSSTRCYPA